MDNKEPKHLKRVVVKEELVALTGDWLKALILNQFLYWTQRKREFDKFLAEEQMRCKTAGIASDQLLNALTSGWVYKSAKELTEELFNVRGEDAVQKALQELVEKKWLITRNNPNHKWDRTLQYRPDIVKIQNDLIGKGYVLEGFPLPFRKSECIPNNAVMEAEENRNGSPQNSEAIPEITPEVTSKKKNRAAVGKPTDGGGEEPDLYFNTKEFLTIFDSLKRERYPDYKTTTNPKKEAALIAPILRQYETDKILKALHRFFTDSDTFIIKNGHRVEEFQSRFPHYLNDADWEGQSPSTRRNGGDPKEEEERKIYRSRWSPGQGFFSTSDRDEYDNGPHGQDDKAFLDKGGRFYNPITYCFSEWSEEKERWIDTDVVNEKAIARDQREEEELQKVRHLLPPITFPPKESY